MYERPELEIILFVEEDVLNVSFGGDWGDDNVGGWT